ncbi:hypothetical protein B0H16DRAFT_1500248 [Mycena metata]|uniref:Uncharacterized protein n=1 Tax=Mycena metata TaxID=1033252 RepID=A0AAD7K9N7_9AGAR|nr:hypothetical protein B0H16DRAFT_1500248 [Mycena metata]
MKFTASTFIALTLIAASRPAHSAPVPLNARGLASIIEGIVGGGIQDIIGDFVGGLAPAALTSTAVSARGFLGDLEGVVGTGIQDIIGTIFSRRSFSDLTDDQVNTFFEWVNQQSTKGGKREVMGRSSLTTALKDAAEALTPGALAGLEKLLSGSGSSSATSATTVVSASATATALSARGLASIIEGIVGGGIQDIIGDFVGGLAPAAPTVSAVSARGLLDDVEGVVGTGIEGILGTIFSRRSFSDLTDDQVNTFFEWVNQQSTKGGKRKVLARSLLTTALKDAAEALTPAALSGLEKLFGSGGSSTATSAAPAAATSLNALD